MELGDELAALWSLTEPDEETAALIAELRLVDNELAGLRGFNALAAASSIVTAKCIVYSENQNGKVEVGITTIGGMQLGAPFTAEKRSKPAEVDWKATSWGLGEVLLVLDFLRRHYGVQLPPGLVLEVMGPVSRVSSNKEVYKLCGPVADLKVGGWSCRGSTRGC